MAQRGRKARVDKEKIDEAFKSSTDRNDFITKVGVLGYKASTAEQYYNRMKRASPKQEAGENAKTP
ncbi:MAG: hypothetical protein ACYCS1_05135 [Gammaproteobacteria bacterium]